MNECRHGRLARACEMCALEDEVRELRAELEEARDRIAEINSLWADECAKSRHAETRADVLRGEAERERASRQQAQINLERAYEDRNRAGMEARMKAHTDTKAAMETLGHMLKEARGALGEVLEFQSAPVGPTIHDWGRWSRAYEAAGGKQ